MLGREPRLPHGVMRVLIIALLLLNAAQVVILQAAINSGAREQLDTTWTYVAISAVGVILALALIAFGFARSRPRGQ